MKIYFYTCDFNIGEKDENDAQSIIFMNALHTFLRRNENTNIWIDLPNFECVADKRKLGSLITIYSDNQDSLQEFLFSGKVNTMRKSGMFKKSELYQKDISEASYFVTLKKAQKNNAKFNSCKFIEYSHIKDNNLIVYAIKIFRRKSLEKQDFSMKVSRYGFNEGYFPIFNILYI